MALHNKKSTLHLTTPDRPYHRETPSLCYFSIPSPGSPYNSASDSDITPLSSPLTVPDTPSDPRFPLLAFRESELRPMPSQAIDASKLLQLQTAAAYANVPHRPKPRVIQDVLEISGDEGSDDAKSSSSSSSSSSSVNSSSGTSRRTSMQSETVRCSRCKRTSFLGSLEQKTRFVSYGVNLYYCKTCANMVGYGHG